MISPAVSIILVNWNNARDTLACLESLKNVHYKEMSVMVVDNGSPDNSLEQIRDWLGQSSCPFPVTIIPLPENIGFGGANNIGIIEALRRGSPYVLLLNNDTVVEPDFLEHMIDTMRSADRTGIVGGKIYSMSDRKTIWYCGGWIDFVKGRAYHVREDLTGKTETSLVTGCLALLNMDAIKDVGIFDERFFLNVEDWDLSLRMKQAGWKLIVDTDAIIYHKISGSIGGTRSLRNQYYFHRNRLLFFSKHLYSFHKTLFFMVQVVLVIPVWALIQLFTGNFVGFKAFYWAVRDFLTKNFGKSPYV